jgi:hypothetical protein
MPGVGSLEVFLSRYTISKPSVIVEIDPRTGEVLREFARPETWEWDSSRPHAHWEEYRGPKFYVYFHDGHLVFQSDQERFVLDSSYSSEIKRVLVFWLRFVLRRNGAVVFQFRYRDPQSRPAGFLFDDWWDLDTPFEFVHEHLQKQESRATPSR